MPFDIKTPIAYGWIPNDSGDVTEVGNIEYRIGFSEPDSEFTLLYELYEDDAVPCIAVSPVDHPEIVIAPYDERGMCLIGRNTGAGALSSENDSDTALVVDECWMRICRKLGESSKSTFGCTAMEKPLRFKSDIYVYEGIAEWLLEYTRQITLYAGYNASFGLAFRSNDWKSSFDANMSYLKRFLGIYSKELSVMMANYTSRHEFVSSINKAVENYISRKYRVRVDRSMMLLGAITLLATVIISVIGLR